MAKGLSLPMDSHDLKRLSDGLLEDEAEVMLKLLSVREPKPIDGMGDEVRGRRFCPSCGSAMWRNGTDNRHQKWVCPECGRTVRSGCLGPAESIKKSAAVWLRFVACELHRMTLREEAAECGVSLTQAFYLRHKMQEALSERLGRIELSGRVELDGKAFRLSLKGTKTKDMPRPSKERGSGTRGLSDRVVTIWAIDENDAMAAKVVGLGQESRDKADMMLPHLKNCKVLVTDDKSCYEGFARDNGFAHVQIKSVAHSSESGETMNEVNALMSDFETWSARYCGVSTRHLQGYIDRFLFQKMLGYAKEALDRPGAQLRDILAEKAVIECREILKKAMPVDLYEAYGSLGYGIFAK